MTLDELIPDSTIPAGEQGEARIEKFTVTRADASCYNMSVMFQGGRRTIQPGDYTRLYVGDVLMMSDTIVEKRDHRACVQAGTGTCFVAGLGLGMVAVALARKPEVERVIVMELSRDVIDLVAPHMPEKVEVIQGDLLSDPIPKGKFDTIWLDIWSSISVDDAATRALASRRLAQRKRGFMGSWAADEFRAAKQRDYNQSRR